MYITVNEFTTAIRSLQSRLDAVEKQHRNTLQLLLSNINAIELPEQTINSMNNVYSEYGEEATIKLLIREYGIAREQAESIFVRAFLPASAEVRGST